MADKKQTVEIAFKVVGIDIKKIDSFAGAFTKLQKSINSATTSINKFQKSLAKIKTPPSFARLATSLEKLEKVKLTNIGEITKSLIELNKIKPSNTIPTLTKSLVQLSGVKLPNVERLAKGLQLLVNTKFSGFGMKVTSITTALKQFKDISVPKILQLANGLKLLMETKFGGFNLKITSLVQGLIRLKGITLPNVKLMSAGLKELTELKISVVAKKIRDLNVALAQLGKRGHLASFKTFASDLRKVQGALGQAGLSANKAATALRQVGTAAHNSGLKLRTFGDKIRTVMEFRLISEGLLQLKAALSGATTAIIEYDQALKDLQAITGATDTEVAQMGATIVEVASRTKFSASEVAEGMRVIGQSGFDAGEAIQTMQAVSDLATGTLSSMATTVDLVTTAMRVFDVDASRSTEVVDVFANAVNKSKLTIDKLRTAMNFVGPIAKESGVSFKELSAAMGTLANSGIRASTIGTGLRRVFAELVDPSKKLKAAADAVGVSLRDLSPESNDLSGVLQNLKLVVKDAGTAFDIFGKRGAASVLALTSSTSKFDKMLGLVSRSGTAAEQASKQMEGLGISFKNLKDKLGVLAIAIGKSGLAASFKLLVDAARFLVDTFILFAGTPLGNLVVSLGILVTAIAAVTVAWAALGAVVALPVFAAMSAALASIVTGFVAASVAASTFLASMGPLGIALLALTATWYAFNSSFEATSGDLLILASEFENLIKKVTDYKVAVAGLDKGSTEHVNKTKALRLHLLKVAEGYGEVAEEAAKVAATIDPLKGTFTDGEKALAKYSETLNRLNFETLAKSAVRANEELTTSLGFFQTKIRAVKDGFKELAVLLTKGEKKRSVFFNQSRDAEKLALALRKNNIGFKELADHVESLDRRSKNLSSTNKVLIARYDAIVETSKSIFQNLQRTGDVDVMSTVEGFEDLMESLEYTGPILEALNLQFVKFKKLNEGKITNSIEKWAKDLTDEKVSLVDFMDTHKELVGSFLKGEEDQIRSSARKKAQLVKDLAEAKKLYAEEMKMAKGVDRLAATQKFLDTEAKLVEAADKINSDIAKNQSAQRIRALQFELDNAEKLRQKARANQTYGELELARRIKEINVKSAKRIADIKAGAVDPITPKMRLAAYKLDLQKRETTLAKHMDKIALLEAKGVLTEDEAAKKKLQATLSFYAVSYRNAVEFRDKINRLENPEDYDKAHKQVLQAEESYYKQRTKYKIEYTKAATKLNEQITDTDEKLQDELKENAKEVKDIREDLVDKLVELEKTYSTKVQKINKDLANKLKDIDESIADNRKKTIQDVLSLTSSTEEKIRNVRKRGMTEEGQNDSDKLAAQKYLAQGQDLISQAQQSKDQDQLARGVDLIRQSESLAGGLKNERNAVNLLRAALASLKDARNLEGELKELDLIQKKNDEIAKAEEKRIAAEQGYKDKVDAATTANTELLALETIRHDAEMKNLNAEIDAYKTKLKLVKEVLSGLTGEKTKDTSSKEQGTSTESTAKFKAIEKEIELERQKTQVAIQGYRVINEAGVRTFTDLTDKARNLQDSFNVIKEDGVQTFSEISKAGEEAFAAVTSGTDENGVRFWTEISELSKEATDEIVENTLEGVQAFEEIGTTAIESIDGIKEAVVEVQDEAANIVLEPQVENIDEVMNLQDQIRIVHELIRRPFEIVLRIIGFNELRNLIKTIAQLKNKKVYIDVITRYSYTGKKAVKNALGGRLPGFGGGDKVPVLGEAGEWWINKFAVRKYGDAFMSSINNMSLPKFADGGRVGASDPGGANGSSETLVVRFQAGGLEAPVKITDTNSRIAIKNMANELTKMRLIYAR